MSVFNTICKHGWLARQCDRCELDDEIEHLRTALAEVRADAERYKYLLQSAVDMLHECGLRDEIWTALEGKS